MMWRTHLRKSRATMAALAIAVAFAAGDATASWIFIDDAHLDDLATNPGYPVNQSSAKVGAYLQDLLDLESAPTYKSKNDSYAGGALSGLGNPAENEALLLAFHFGNGNDYDEWPHDGPFDVFFGCSVDCDTFTLPNTKAISNYRLYSAPVEFPSDTCCEEPFEVNAVPEPASIALLGLGLAGLTFSRRRRR